jgi:16S rRNA (cytosine967-C5)-methyltransferase
MTVRITAKMLDAAAELLRQLLTFTQPADAVISQYFRSHRELGPRERAFIAESVYAVLRRKRLLERLCGPQPKARQLLLAALAKLHGVSQRQFGELLDKDETAWLIALKGQAEPELSLAEQADFPDWLCERLARDRSPDAILALARGLNQPAPLDLRVNPLKTSREAVLARLAADGIEAVPCRLAPLGIRLKEKPVLARHPLYLGGDIEVQDEGSQLLAHLLDPKRGEMVVDFCAGAGGKTLLLGALMRSTGRLYAFDVADKRLARLKPRVARSGLSNVHPACISGENDARIKRLAGKIDRVLVDAPCSGLGTLRRNPDLKWRQTATSVAELARKQHDILAAAARLVKLGGRLVYATCSILSEENEDVVASFLQEHAGFRRLSAAGLLAGQKIALAEREGSEDMRLLPHLDDTDGFYAAVLERNA